MDPKAEKKPFLTPYHYCSNNPIVRIDPDGQNDYFNANGNYLGSDNTEEDNVRIITQNNWEAVQSKGENGNVTVDAETAMLVSTAFSEAKGMEEESILNVYDHYNPTDLPLQANENETGEGGASFVASRKDGKTTERLDIKIEANKDARIADHANEIINIFEHEKQHYEDYKQIGFDGYKTLAKDIKEQRSIQHQISHTSFKKTRKGFQRGTINYGKKYNMLFKVKPIGIK